MAPASGTLVARTLQTDDVTDFDTVLSLRETCADQSDEVCDDDGAAADVAFDSFLETDLVAGTTYFLSIDGFATGAPAATQSVTVEFVFTAAP